ncbi:MAG: VOC family protein [Gammaproteobacteria bacterium]|nr:VOC family protein [Gammaproteobacteria bacterium]
MPVELSKNAIDLGIVTNNAEAMLAFYRDLLGFVEEPSTPFPMGGTMYRLWCGESLIKIVVPDPAVTGVAPPGPITRAVGYRYWTMRVTNLEAMMEQCEAAGAKIVVPVTSPRPGVTIGMVEDPDGNWVEFVNYAG